MTASLLTVAGLRVHLGVAEILPGLDLAVAAGSRHALIGPNGAGKSTLLNAIAGTVRPTSGRIVLAGDDITALAPHRRARAGIARTWQHPALCAQASALDNVALAVGGRYRHAQGAARRALLDAGLGAHLATITGRLPYGLQRRLELVVALARKPKLLLLDEPSAGLSPGETRSLITQLTALPADTTVLLVDHDLDVVSAVAHQVTVLHHGQVVATGTPEQIRRDPAVEQVYPQSAGATVSAAATTSGPVILDVSGLTTGYFGAPVLEQVSLQVAEGEVLGITGTNGTGKSTLLNTIAGLHPATPATRITIGGRRVQRLAAAERARCGIGLVPQDRRLFAGLTVGENLRVPQRVRGAAGPDPTALFPSLQGRARQVAGSLSGGEQQMLAIARALIASPMVLLLDEPFEGLAPAVIAQLRHAIDELTGAGLAVVIADHRADRFRSIGVRVMDLIGGRLVDTLSPSSNPGSAFLNRPRSGKDRDHRIR